MISKIYYSIVAFLIIVTLVACELFTEGYGDKVDLSNPEITIDSPANGQYVNGQFVLKGTATDDTGVSSVVVEFVSSVTDAAVSYTATVSDSNWYLDIDSSNSDIFDDGEVEFNVTVNDTASKNSSKSRILYFDNTNPTVVVSSPGSDEIENINGDVTISGEVEDLKIDRVEVYLVSTSDSTERIGGVADGTSSWDYDIDTITKGLGITNLESYYIEVTAYDAAGNTNTYFYYNDDLSSVKDSLGVTSVTMDVLTNSSNASILSTIQRSSTNQLVMDIDQNQDTPKFEDLEEWNLGDEDNYTGFATDVNIYGRITDDDGIESIVLSIYNEDDDTLARQGTLYPNGDTDFSLEVGVESALWTSNTDYTWNMTSGLTGGSDDLAEDAYYFTMTVKDIEYSTSADNPGTGIAMLENPGHFGIDKTAPTVTIENIAYLDRDGDPANIENPSLYGETINANFTISGQATDAVHIEKVVVYLDGEDAVEASYDDETNIWSYDVVKDGDYSGDVEVVVTAYDDEETGDNVKTDSKTLSIYMDKTVPSITDVDLPTNINGTITISGKASDSQLESVQYSVGGITGTIDPDGSSWSFELNTVDLFSSEAEYNSVVSQDFTLGIWAYDESGNKSDDLGDEYNTLTVVPSSDLPTVTFDSADNKFTTGSSISGTAIDDDDISDSGSGNIVLTFYNRGETTALTSIEATQTYNKGTDVGWSSGVLGLDSGLNLDEGLYDYTISVKDNHTVNADLTTDSIKTYTSDPISFTIDDGEPTLTETAIGSSSLKYINTNKVLTGKATDGTGISSLTISINGSATEELTLDSNIWEYTFDLDTFSNGDYEVVIVASDNSGSSTTLTRNIIVDTVGPSITTYTVDGDSTTDSTPEFSGTISDYSVGLPTTRTLTVDYEITDNVGTTSTKSKTITTTNSSWSGDLDFGSNEGSASITVSSADKLNNTTTTDAITLYYDASSPVLTEDEINIVDTQYTLDTVTFGGSSYDSNKLTSLVAYIYSVVDGVETLKSSNDLTIDLDGDDNILGDDSDTLDVNESLDDNAWSFTTGESTADGTYIIKFVATDIANKTTTITRNIVIDSTYPVLTVVDLSDDYTYGLTNVSGTISDNIGVDYVEFQIQDGTWETASLTSSGTTNKYNWKGTIDLETEELFTFNVRAYDKAGNEVSNYDNISDGSDNKIYIDESNPTLTEDHDDTIYTNSNYSLTGTVSDTLGLKTVFVDGTDVKPTVGSTWSYAEDSPSEGEHNYTIIAKDLADRTTSIERTVIYDITAPVITITSPTVTYLSGTSYTFKGVSTGPSNSSDLSGISKVEYQIQDRNYDSDSDSWISTSNSDSWLEASGTDSWSVYYELTDGDEGKKSLFVRSLDNAGNISDEYTLDFIYDQAAPSLSVITTPATLTNGSFTIAGTASDSHGIEGDIVEIIIDGVTNNVAIDENDEWTFSGDLSAKDDGYYIIEAITYDVEGRESVKVSNNIQLDQEAPTVSFSDLTSGDSINGSSYTVSGKSSDNYQIDTVKYEYKYNDGEYSTATLVTGTNYNWTFDLDLQPTGSEISDYLEDGVNILDIKVTVVDKAGNITESEVLPLTINQEDDKPVMQISSLDDYISPTIVTIDEDLSQDILTGVIIDEAGVDATSISIKVDETTYSPTIISDTGKFVSWFVDLSELSDGDYTINFVTALNDDADTANGIYYGVPGDDISVLNTSSKIIGSVTDDDNVDYTTLKISIDGETAVAFSDETSNSTRIDWDYTLNALSSGLHYIEFSASDIYGIPVDWSKYSDSNPGVLILQDTASPTILVETPSQSGYVNRSEGSNGYAWDDSRIKRLLITATNSDGSSMIVNTFLDNDELWYNSTNNIDTDNDGNADLSSQEAYGWDFLFSAENIPDEYTGESITLSYDATDIAGNNSLKERTITIDDTVPVVEFTYPDSDLKNVNGEITLSGTITESNISEVFIMVGKSEIENYESSPSSYSQGKTYYWSRTIDDISDFANATDATEDGTDTNLWVLPIEIVAIDKAGNTTINTDMNLLVDPDRDAPELDILYPLNNANIGGSVRLSGTANDDDAVSYVEMRMDLDNDGSFDKVIDFWDGLDSEPTGSSNGVYTDDFEDESLWYEINGQDSWYITINKYGELYEGLIYNTQSGGTVTLDGEITVEIRAVDVYGLAGNVETLTFTLDSTVPTITNESHYTGDYDNGIITLTADIGDDDSGEISEIWISYNSGTNWENLSIPSSDGGSTTYISRTSKTDMSLSIDLDTLDSDSDAYVYNSSTGYATGQLKMAVKVIDSSNYTTIKNITIYVDNEDPEISLDTSTGKTDIDDISGEEALITGEARDNGAVAGIEKVYLYFSRDGNSLIDITDGTNISLGSYDAEDDFNLIIEDDTFTNALIVIDDMDEYGDKDSGGADDDDYSEYITDLVPTNWYAKFDSTNIDDGIADLHYIVYDLAGNSVLETQEDILFANFKPEINEVKVGFNADRSTDSIKVDEGEKFVYEDGTIPTVYDYLSIDITANDSDGIKSYQVFNDALVEIQSSASGELDISGYSGENTFLIKVTDFNDVYTYKEIIVNVDNYDYTDPTVYIYSLNGETYIDESNETITNIDSDGKVLATLDSGENTTGHIELGDYSNNDGTDPDISGVVVISGYAEEDRVLNSIVININGSDVVTSNFSNGVWTDVTGLTVETESFDSDGHKIHWSYTWDTSTISGVANNNIEFAIKATNFGDNDSASSGVQYGSSTESTIYDVVPYITNITRYSDYNTNRSKYGKYPIQQDEDSIIISGYNLDPSAVYISNDPSSTITTSNSDEISFSGVSSGFDEFTIDTSSDGSSNIDISSGWLRLVVNGVEAINNINDDSQKYNREDDDDSDDDSTYWDDDRYFDVWLTGNSFPNSDSPKHPAMAISSNGTLYASWSDYVGSDSYYATESSSTNYFGTYDPPEWTDITVEGTGTPHIVYLANYYNGGNTWGSLRVRDNYSNATVEQLGDDYNSNSNKSDGMDEYLYQFQNPRIAFYDDKNYVSYYDEYSKSLKYGVTNGSTATFTTNNGNKTSGYTVVAGTEDTTDTPDNTWDAGLWSDIQIDSIGEESTDYRPVIVFYDTTDSTLKVARGNNSMPSQTSEWTVSNVLSSKSFIGYYVSLKIDSTGALHISAFKSSNGDLIYITADNVDDDGTYSFTSSIIDSEGSVGAWSDMELDGSSPLIGYVNNSMLGTFDGLKIAIENSGEDEWEHMVVPASSALYDGRVSIVKNTDSTGVWDYALSYISSDYAIVKHIPVK